MAILPMVKLAGRTLTTSETTVTFDNIPQNYDELLIYVVVRGAGSVTNNDNFGSFSGQLGTDHVQYARFSGNGSTASYDQFLTGGSGFRVCQMPGASSTSNHFAAAQIRVPNYTSTSAKVFWTQGGYAVSGQTSYIDQTSGMYSAASAITSVRFDAGSGTGYAAGSSFTIYGISRNQSEASVKATGGQVYMDSSYIYHVFKTSGKFTPNQSITADVLVVAGGGGGGQYSGGGGGAGGLLEHSSQSLTATDYSVVVGAGGTAGSGANGNPGTNGNNSSFGALTVCVGGGYGYGKNGTKQAGGNGGSGGGAGGVSSSANGGTGTSGQGYAGGNSSYAYAGAGGGGAGAAAANATSGSTNGGIGATSSLINAIGAATGFGALSGGNYYFAGGGAGNAEGGAKTGGLGGGGNTYAAGTPNTGGGGGGDSGGGGSGGSGIVIVRYAK